MRFEGVLSAWNHEAGYGSIRPTGGGDEIFVGLAAFPTDGEGPRPDEALSFEIVTNREGRKQAVNLKRLPRSPLTPALREAAGGARVKARLAQQRKRRIALGAGAAVVTALLVLGGLQWWPNGDRSEVPAGMRR